MDFYGKEDEKVEVVVEVCLECIGVLIFDEIEDNVIEGDSDVGEKEGLFL